MDEFSEILILMQEGNMPKMPMFLIGKSFWRGLDRWYAEKMERQMHTIAKGDRKIYTITDDIDKVVTAANKIGHPSIYDNIYNNFSSTI
jgi:predicted Rossmann-fold nucleotide-binding protein